MNINNIPGHGNGISAFFTSSNNKHKLSAAFYPKYNNPALFNLPLLCNDDHKLHLLLA
jgi:hypothetical protein